MSIQIYLSDTGQRLSLDPAVTSLDALRTWLENKTNIVAKAQILLTAQGKQVRSQTLFNENELFVFDSKLFAPQSQSPAPKIAKIDEYDPGAVPEAARDTNSLAAWQDLFAQRKTWAQALLAGCTQLANKADFLLEQNHVIARSVSVAVASLQQHVKSGEKKYNTLATWVDEVTQEQDAHTAGWERNLESLRDVPARADFLRFVNPGDTSSRRLSQSSATTTLQAFVDVAKVRQAANAASQVRNDLSKRLAALNTKLSSATLDSNDLREVVDRFQGSNRSLQNTNSEPAELRGEMDLIVQKITSDYQHIQLLPRSTQSVTQASKIALLHTRNHIPGLQEYCIEMNELVQRIAKQRVSTAASALDYMRTLSAVESRLAELYTETSAFGLNDEDRQDMAAVAIVGRLPSVYGQLLVEAARRREWVAKMKRDSAILQEEMATYQEEEEKRRRRWMRSVEDVVSLEAIEATRALGIELSLQNEGGSWPMVTRTELTVYLETLTKVYGPGPVVEEMDQAIKELDKPTRKQIKRAKAFKNGSMHETAFGDTSLLLRGEEQNKAVRDSNARLEEDLKASKSRIRKLEDLLHRSTQSSRANNGDLFGHRGMGDRRITPPYLPSSQLSGEMSPSTSARHRRLSSNLGIEEKKLARRVVDLEAELQVFRDEANSRKNSDADAQRQLDDAVSTKKDLMENMEAQQREFATERRNLEVELRDAKDKLEEIETEIERMAGSRDDERTGIVARFTGMEEEMKQLKDDAAGHAARAATEQDNRHTMEQKLRIAESARASAEEELQRLRLEQELTREAQTEQTERLMAAYSHLKTDQSVPNTFAGITIALEDLARRSAAHVKDLEEAVAFARSEGASLRTLADKQKIDLASAAQKRIDVEDEARRSREILTAEEAKSTSLQKQLQDEQDQLKHLRSKFADGETGSEVLRQRVADEEARAAQSASLLAETQSQVNSLSNELARLRQDRQETQTGYDNAADRLDKRASRAKDISHKLYAQNARLGRLLERLGLAISYNDNTMVVERASKMNASTINEATLVLSRTTSRTSPPPTRKSSSSEDSSDLSMLRWSNAQTSEEESAQYEAFAQYLARFNIDTIADAIVKRVRDFEYTAKKYNKESKEATKRADAYKERTLRLRGEAHSKLAVKDFKEGDLALFLPTRGQAKGAWAAFNIGCPHYFLAEKEGMRLGSRDFIVARISKVEQKVVDLSRSHGDGRSMDDTSSAQSIEDDNPFDLSDGLTWWMVHASEERVAGAAPTTPGLSKSTVAAANVDARGSVRVKRSSKGDDASKHLNKSLDSRRSSTGSKKSVAGAVVPTIATSPVGPSILHESYAARQRSESQASLKPPPASPGSLNVQANQPSGLASGLGIVASTPQLEEARPLHDQVRKLSAQKVPRAQSISPSKDDRRVRSTSPSKSITSLRQHLETSPSRASNKGWNNIFSADFTLSSPTKGDKP